MKTHTLIMVLLVKSSLLLGQAKPSKPIQTPTGTVRSTPVPRHLVYAHFLAMVNEFEKRAVAVGDPDPYKFAQPFSRAGLEDADLDILGQHAKALTTDLSAQDQKAKTLVAAYRERAKTERQQGRPLPPLPMELHQLQAARTAIAINHMLTLQSALGKDKTARLEAYLAREVTPHVSLEVLAHPPAVADASTASANFVLQK